MSGRVQGFSLIEILMVCTIIAVLSYVSLPSYETYLRETKITVTAKQIQSAIQLARDEALLRNLPVSIKVSSANLWVFVDENESGEISNPNDIITTLDLAMYPVHWRASKKISVLRWYPEGETRAVSGTFSCCDDVLHWEVRVGLSGRVRLVQSKDLITTRYSTLLVQ